MLDNGTCIGVWNTMNRAGLLYLFGLIVLWFAQFTMSWFDEFKWSLVFSKHISFSLILFLLESVSKIICIAFCPLQNPQSILIIQYHIRLTYPYDVRITLKITENAYRLHIMFYKTPNLTQRYFISNGMFKEQTQRNYDCTSCLCYIENYIILLRKERKTNLKCSAALRFFAIIFGFFFALAFK